MAENGDVPVRSAGTGPALWYFHDEVSVGPGPAAARLAEDFRVLAPIHPGFAGAPRPSWVETVRDVADVYLPMVRSRHKAGTPLVLIGSSLGGWIAVEVALAVYDLDPHVVLIGPLGLSVPGHPPADHWFMTDAERDATLFCDPAAKPEVELEEFIGNESMTARLGWSPRFADRSLLPRLRRLTSPVLTIWGREDRLLPSAHRTEWAVRLPQSTSVLLTRCGHYPVYERPDEVAAAVTAFVARHTALPQGVPS